MLIIDSDESFLSQASHIFEATLPVSTASDMECARRFINQNMYDVILADLNLVNGSIREILLRNTYSQAMVIVTSRENQVDEAIVAIKEGAFDYIQKPFSLAQLTMKVQKAIEIKRLQQDTLNLRGQMPFIFKTLDFIAESQPIKEVLNVVTKVAQSDSSIIIQGETGTGKEMVAGAIHYSSHRKAAPFVKVNCAALSEELLEQELFGYETGNITGKDNFRIGRFEQANGGTIFLDEIGDMNLKTQAKILRVIQDKTFQRMGSNRTIRVDVRILSATNKKLQEEVQQDRFREDLYYRLNVMTIKVPPLRERQEDIIPLSIYFTKKISNEIKKHIANIDSKAIEALLDYHWPGNIRELRNTIERAVLLADDPIIKREDLNIYSQNTEETSLVEIPIGTYSLEELEKQAIIKALRHCNWVQKNAARLLQISSRVLNYKIKKHGITHNSWKIFNT